MKSTIPRTGAGEDRGGDSPGEDRDGDSPGEDRDGDSPDDGDSPGEHCDGDSPEGKTVMGIPQSSHCKRRNGTNSDVIVEGKSPEANRSRWSVARGDALRSLEANCLCE